MKLDIQTLIERKLAQKTKNPDILAILSTHADPTIRQTVAQNEFSPKKIVGELARDSDPEVRFSAAHHKNLPAEAVPYLANDRDPWIRRAAASHPEAPLTTLEVLLHDNDDQTVCNVITHPKCSKDLIKEAFDKISKEKPPAPTEQELFTALLTNSSVKSSNYNYRVLKAIASAPNCPSHIMTCILNDEKKDRKKIRPKTDLFTQKIIENGKRVAESQNKKTLELDSLVAGLALLQNDKYGQNLLTDTFDTPAQEIHWPKSLREKAMSAETIAPQTVLYKSFDLEPSFKKIINALYRKDQALPVNEFLQEILFSEEALKFEEVKEFRAANNITPNQGFSTPVKLKNFNLTEEETFKIKTALYLNPKCPPELRSAIYEQLIEIGIGYYGTSLLPLKSLQNDLKSVQEYSQNDIEKTLSSYSTRERKFLARSHSIISDRVKGCLDSFPNLDKQLAPYLKSLFSPNPNIQNAVLESLSKDSDPTVRHAATQHIKNSNSPLHISAGEEPPSKIETLARKLIAILPNTLLLPDDLREALHLAEERQAQSIPQKTNEDPKIKNSLGDDLTAAYNTIQNAIEGVVVEAFERNFTKKPKQPAQSPANRNDSGMPM